MTEEEEEEDEEEEEEEEEEGIFFIKKRSTSSYPILTLSLLYRNIFYNVLFSYNFNSKPFLTEEGHLLQRFKTSGGNLFYM
jgi:hypothetical protein